MALNSWFDSSSSRIVLSSSLRVSSSSAQLRNPRRFGRSLRRLDDFAFRLVLEGNEQKVLAVVRHWPRRNPDRGRVAVAPDLRAADANDSFLPVCLPHGGAKSRCQPLA